MSFNRKTDKSIVAVEYYTAVKMNKLEWYINVDKTHKVLG